jgi:hypothetical protein
LTVRPLISNLAHCCIERQQRHTCTSLVACSASQRVCSEIQGRACIFDLQVGREVVDIGIARLLGVNAADGNIGKSGKAAVVPIHAR